MNIARELKADDTYLRAKKVLDSIKENVNTDDIIKELFSLHASRGVAALRPNKILQSALHHVVNSTAQELTVRSRVTTIKMNALASLLKIEEVLDPLKKYALSKYGNKLKDRGHKTLASQRAAIDSALKVFTTETRRMDYVIKIADLVMSDVDSANWGLKRIADVLEQSSKDR